MHQLRFDQRVQLSYEHIQTSPIRLLVVVVLLAVVGATVVFGGGTEPFVLAFVSTIVVLVALVSYVFGKLTVEVSPSAGTVTATFGWGWPKRRIDLDAIEGVEQVRNRWWYGWGLRWIPGGTLYNVWGLDAVELQFGDGRVFRIGTDDGAELRTALETARRQPPGR